jgi:hypothetical protein
MANLVTTKIILRKAQLWDVFYNGYTKRIGQPFWLKRMSTGKFDNRAYLVEQSTNSKELKQWVELGMCFVPASDVEIIKSPPPVPNDQLPVNNEQLSLTQ